MPTVPRYKKTNVSNKLTHTGSAVNVPRETDIHSHIKTTHS